MTPQAPADGGPDARLAEAALDTLAGIIRAMGRYAFEMNSGDHEAFLHDCEGWARHILTGVAVEEVEEVDDEESTADEIARGIERDWQKLRHFYRFRRKEEQDFVTGQQSEFKDVIWSLIEGLNVFTGGSREAEQKITSSLGKLESSAVSGSLEALRAVVGEAVGAIKEELENQRSRTNAQMQIMSERLTTMRADLLDARRASETDPLTNVHNRGWFDEVLACQVNLQTLTGQPLLLMILDLDHFKKVNDEFGHPVGDKVLQATADTIVRTFPRKSDFVARYGGEEFVVILSDVAVEEATMLAEKLLQKVREIEIEEKGRPIRITCSIGYTYLEVDDTPATLVARADSALYQAKTAGRDRAEAG